MGLTDMGVSTFLGVPNSILGSVLGSHVLRKLPYCHKCHVCCSGLPGHYLQLPRTHVTIIVSQVDRIWDIWESYYNIPEAIFYLLKGDYN